MPSFALCQSHVDLIVLRGVIAIFNCIAFVANRFVVHKNSLQFVTAPIITRSLRNKRIKLLAYAIVWNQSPVHPQTLSLKLEVTWLGFGLFQHSAWLVHVQLDHFDQAAGMSSWIASYLRLVSKSSRHSAVSVKLRSPRVWVESLENCNR